LQSRKGGPKLDFSPNLNSKRSVDAIFDKRRQRSAHRTRG
jgi:hypothetical protein